MPSLRHLVPILLALAVAATSGCSRAAKKDRLLQSADRFVAHARYDQAEVEYLKVLRLDPRERRATRGLGLVYAEQGRTTRALPYLQTAVQWEPADAALRLRYGQVCLAKGLVAEASAAALAVLDFAAADSAAPLLLAEAALNPAAIAAARLRLTALPDVDTSAPVLVALATLDLRQNNFVSAAARLQRARAIDPGSPAIASAFGGLYLAQDDPARAEPELRAASHAAPLRSARRLQYARFLLQSGDRKGARQELEAIHREAPDYLPVWIWLAEIALVEQQLPDAERLINRALARDPDDGEARLLHARWQLAQGAADNAVTELERLTATGPASAPVYYHLALAQLVQGASTRAAGNLNRALQLAPGFADATLVLAGLNIRSGAAAAAVTPLRQLARERPKLAGARLLLADAYRAQRAFGDARRIYQELEQEFAPNPQTPLLIGALELQLGRTDAAREAFTRALTLAPDFIPALEQLVALDLAASQPAAARQRIDAALQRQPGAAGLHLLRAQALLATRDHAGAEIALREAIRLQPDAGAAYYLLAKVCMSTGDADGALRGLRDALAQRPNDIPARLLLAEISEQQSNYAAAREAYEAILGFDPRFTLALNNLAVLVAEHFDDSDRAYDLARRARALKPQDPHIADTLGWLLYRQRQYARAVPLLEESAVQLPRSAEVQAHVGLARYFAGAEAPAREALERSIALGGVFPGREEVDQALAVLAVDPRTAAATDRARLEKRLREFPGDVVALGRLAAVLDAAGAGDDAVSLYSRLLTENPAHPQALARLVARDRAAGDLAGAVERVKAARKKAPDDPQAAGLLGQLLYASGDFQSAAGLLEPAVRDERTDPEALLAYGLAAYASGRLTAAEAAARDLLRLDAQGPHAGLARVLLAATSSAGEPDEHAIVEAETILRRDPEFLPARMITVLHGSSPASSNDAAMGCEQLLQHYPAFVPAQRQLALLLARARLSDARALAAGLAARSALPNDPDVAAALGLILYQRGEFAKAKGLLSEGVVARPDDGELLWHLGMAQHKTNDVAAARRTLERALKCSLPVEWAAEARGIARRE